MDLYTMDSKIVLVKMGSTLKHNHHIEELKKLIKKTIGDQFSGQLKDLGNDVSFILYVCNLVETLYKKPKNEKAKINKKELVINLIREICPNIDTVPAINMLEKSIEYLFEAGSIMPVTQTKQVFSGLKSFFLKKVLA
jgi:hypothetical protein